MKKKKTIPFEFVLEELASYPRVNLVTKPMFGFLGIYNGPKIVMVLRDKDSHPKDNGVWVCTEIEHHESLRKELPIMKSLTEFGEGVSAWQVLRASDPKFESCVYAACKLIGEGDPRIGRLPKSKLRKKKRAK